MEEADLPFTDEEIVFVASRWLECEARTRAMRPVDRSNEVLRAMIVRGARLELVVRAGRLLEMHESSRDAPSARRLRTMMTLGRAVRILHGAQPSAASGARRRAGSA